MNIGFDAKRVVRNGTGLGSYGRTLVGDLSGDSRLQLHLYAPDEGRRELREQVSRLPHVQMHYAPRYTPKAWWRSRGIISQLRADGVQLYHGLSGELPVGISRAGIRSVVTIHDLIFLRHPEFYHWTDTKLYAWKFRQTIREADHIIAISECTRRDIIELGGVDESRISVIYQSCAPRFKRGEGSVERGAFATAFGSYILSVGSIEARKNILLAVKALAYLPERLHLVVVGRHTKYTDQVLAYAASHGLSARLHILHGITDEQLPALYAQAEAFVYPSVYEGFGIPIIEAIRCGLPVVACTGSCLEEAGGPDSLYVAPDDVQGMAHAITSVLRGAPGRERRIELSQRYVARFDNADVARQIVDTYYHILEGR